MLHINGVLPFSSCVLMDALLLSSQCTSLSLPFWIARCNAVLPLLSGMFTSTPFFISKSATLLLPENQNWKLIDRIRLWINCCVITNLLRSILTKLCDQIYFDNLLRLRDLLILFNKMAKLRTCRSNFSLYRHSPSTIWSYPDRMKTANKQFSIILVWIKCQKTYTVTRW